MHTEKFKTRRNVIKLSSPEEFRNAKGSCSQNCREVYFLRIEGLNGQVLQEILSMDRILTEDMYSGNGYYHRWSSLPRLADTEDANYYGGCYEEWNRNGRQRIPLKFAEHQQELSHILSCACEEALDVLRKCKPGLSVSMEKNFVVKLLYWLDHTVAAALENWKPQDTRKVVFENICRQQEYLFCFLLTLLGFDVLLIQSNQDLDRELEGLGLSVLCRTEHREEISLPEYMDRSCRNSPGQGTASACQPEGKASPGPARVKVNTRVPERDKRTREMMDAGQKKTAAGAGRGQSVSLQPSGSLQGNHTGNAQRRELSYEELATLASSVVQIMIHDDRGDVIGGGSGIMIGRDGYILTNNHVACRGRYYSVRIEEDEKVYQTDEMIKYNSVLDLAVLRIQRKLQPIPLYGGEKKLVRGQKVVAIGSPLGLFNSVSDGIISGFRVIEGVDMIQFTAPISHGSSEGAVLNMYGEVIGISTAGYDDGQNINLAVGYEYIRAFVQGFIR